MESATARKANGPEWAYITPMIFTLLPLIRIGFRHNPKLRNRLFYGAVGLGLMHGTWLILRKGEDKVEEEQFYHPDSLRVTTPARSTKPAVLIEDDRKQLK